jgi:hypothetical protein
LPSFDSSCWKKIQLFSDCEEDFSVHLRSSPSSVSFLFFLNSHRYTHLVLLVFRDSVTGFLESCRHHFVVQYVVVFDAVAVESSGVFEESRERLLEAKGSMDLLLGKM